MRAALDGNTEKLKDLIHQGADITNQIRSTLMSLASLTSGGFQK